MSEKGGLHVQNSHRKDLQEHCGHKERLRVSITAKLDKVAQVQFKLGLFRRFPHKSRFAWVRPTGLCTGQTSTRTRTQRIFWSGPYFLTSAVLHGKEVLHNDTAHAYVSMHSYPLTAFELCAPRLAQGLASVAATEQNSQPRAPFLQSVVPLQHAATMFQLMLILPASNASFG